MSGYSYSDEIAFAFEQVQSYLRMGNEAAALEELDGLRKLVSAELNALAWEANAAMTRETTEREQKRIRGAAHSQTTTWGDHD